MLVDQIIARVRRADFVESLHQVYAVVTNPDGSVAQAWGAPDQEIMPRSANKPFQALAMLAAGAQLEGKFLALAAASHSGEAFHIAAVEQMLAATGLSAADLKNTPDLPLAVPAQIAWCNAGHGKESIAQNCSGKHAGMLTACVAAAWPTENYLDPEHPLQRTVLEQFTAFGIQPSVIVVDGCGAPAHSMRLAELARAYGELAAADSGPRQLVADAYRQFPEYIAGTTRPNTAFMQLLPGAIAKDGAEGVLTIGLADGRGIAIKVADGTARSRYPVLAAILRQLGVGDETLRSRLADEPVLGHGKPVGDIQVEL